MQYSLQRALHTICGAAEKSAPSPSEVYFILLFFSLSFCLFSSSQQLWNLNLASFTDNIFFIMANGKTKQNTGIDECVGVNSASPERAGSDSVWRERVKERGRERERAEHN